MSTVVFANQRTGSSTLSYWFEAGNEKSVISLYEPPFTKYPLHQRNDPSLEIFDDKNGIFREVMQKYKNKEIKLSYFEELVRDIFAHKIVFKVMIEYTPLEVVEIIIKNMSLFQYTGAMIVRNNIIEKFKSLHFSYTNNVYSNDGMHDNMSKHRIQDVHIDEYVKLQKNINESNRVVEDLLLAYKVKYAYMSYEDIFESEMSDELLYKYLRYLGYNPDERQDLRTYDLPGKMKTREYYNVEGLDLLVQRFKQEKLL